MTSYPLSSKWFRGIYVSLILVVLTTSVASGLSLRDPAYNGMWQDYGGGWSYVYYTAADNAYWKLASTYRFGYDYKNGNWSDCDLAGTWRRIGGTGVSGAFLGDGNFQDLKNGWSYQYTASTDTSNWKDGTILRFSYNYTPGQWWQNGYTGGWQVLGSSGLSAAFLGDGVSHSIGNGWSYYYTPSTDTGYWLTNSANRFAYGYVTGQWQDNGNIGGWATLGPAGLSASFLGDGNWHTMDSIWSYELVSGIGYLKGSVSTWLPGTTGDSGSWGSFPTLTCNYTTQNLGLYDSSSTSSVFLYDYNGGSSYSCKWTDWNYNISNKSEISAATVFYTGSTTHDVSSWLSWLSVTPNPGFITRTETWDFRNNDWANRYNHEVRAFGNSMWLVQRAQGSIGNCGIIASIDSLEAKSGLYVGYTKTWQDTAYAKGWCDSGGGTTSSWQANLMVYMGQQYNSPVLGYYGTSTTRSLSDLLSLVSQGQKVVIAIDLHYISEFGSWSPSDNANHAITFVGDTYINSVHYAEITNGWNIQNNTTTLAGFSPTAAYPITYIPWSKLQNAYYAYARIQ